MIKQVAEIIELPCYNTGRPTITCDEELTFWSEVHQYIKDCDYPITVNGAFWMIDQMIEERSKYGGGGYQYNFWFQTPEDKEQFKNYFIGKVYDYKWAMCPYIFEVGRFKNIEYTEPLKPTEEEKAAQQLIIDEYNRTNQEIIRNWINEHRGLK